MPRQEANKSLEMLIFTRENADCLMNLQRFYRELYLRSSSAFFSDCLCRGSLHLRKQQYFMESVYLMCSHVRLKKEMSKYE